MFYDVDFMIKTVDQVLKQNELNPLYQPGYFDEARHRIAMAIEHIGAPMQMVLPKCETSLKVHDISEYGIFYRIRRTGRSFRN